VVAYGGVWDGHPVQVATVDTLGLDKVLMVQRGPWHHQEFSTRLVDVGRGQLLDVVPDRFSTVPIASGQDGWDVVLPGELRHVKTFRFLSKSLHLDEARSHPGV